GLSRLLDQELPEDELQDPVPAHRAARQPALGRTDLSATPAAISRPSSHLAALTLFGHNARRFCPGMLAPGQSLDTEGFTACRKKTASNWKVLSSTPCPTPCSVWSWKTGTSLPRTSPERCARTTSAS